MEDLQDRGRAATFGRYRQLAQARDEAVIMGRKFAGKTDTVGLHVRAAGDDEADVLRPPAIVRIFLIGDGTVVVAGPRGHRRHHDAIAQEQPGHKLHWCE
jgi:hypothetical protein